MNKKCKICGFICENDNVFNITSTFTKHTKLSLKVFIEIVIENEFNFPDTFICTICYDLLNELDKFRENYRVGCERIKQYLQPIPSSNQEIEKVWLENVEEGEIETKPNIESIEIISDIQIPPINNSDIIKDLTKQFVCEICGVSYKTKKSLKVHVGMHNGINPFTCSFCSKSFTQKINLIRHLPLHTGEVPYQCDLCGKSFVHDSSFRQHKQRHKGQKDVKCEQCNLCFFSKSHLKRHERVHSREKRFSCEICGKKFAEKYNLVVHERIHTKNQDKMGLFDEPMIKIEEGVDKSDVFDGGV